MKRVAAGAHLPTPWLFEPAKRPDDEWPTFFNGLVLPTYFNGFMLLRSNQALLNRDLSH